MARARRRRRLAYSRVRARSRCGRQGRQLTLLSKVREQPLTSKPLSTRSPALGFMVMTKEASLSAPSALSQLSAVEPLGIEPIAMADVARATKPRAASPMRRSCFPAVRLAVHCRLHHGDLRASPLHLSYRNQPMPSETYLLFREAILGESQVTCVYRGHDRELCPVIIGHTRGEETVLGLPVRRDEQHQAAARRRMEMSLSRGERRSAARRTLA
jgi:hypothetical protein